MDLFNEPQDKYKSKKDNTAPLAERMRPETLDEFAGQSHLVGRDKPIRQMIEKGEIVSMIFWGPPGIGKTTLALIIAGAINADFIQLSAVSSGVKDVRDAIKRAGQNLKSGTKTILFIDEIHRFNKAQQDSLLQSVEKGLITLIGATTENPSFEVISPLMSRCRLYVLEEPGKEDFEFIIDSALKKDKILSNFDIEIPDRNFLIALSSGDARRLLNGIDLAVKLAKPDETGKLILSNDILKETFQAKNVKYDKNQEEHYNIISAFIKSIRGSDPDAAVYWMARMLKGGEDPKFIARRMIVLASEDIGNADPYAITLAASTFTAIDYIGMPEAQIVLSQCACYLAACPKSNASYMAINDAMSDAENLPNYDVPLHLRNAPTKLMKQLGYHKGYKYTHDYEGHFEEQQYLPKEIEDKLYYKPTDIGTEKKLRDRLNEWWEGKKKKR